MTRSFAQLCLLVSMLSALIAGCDAGGKKDQMLDFATFSRTFDAATTGDCDDRCLRYRKEFDYVVYVGKGIYQYWDVKKAETGVDYDALAASLEAKITSTTTSSQYYWILQSWAASLHDGHVNAMPPADLSGFELYSSPVRLEVLAPGTDHEALIVAEIKDPAGSMLSVGDVVSAVNGVAAKDAITTQAALTSGSTDRMRRFFSARRLVDALGADRGATPLILTATHAGQSQDFELPRSVTLNNIPDPNAVTAASTGIELIKASQLPGGIGYLRIDGFQGTQDAQLFDQALNALAETKGLILDLRKNGGGDQSGNAIIARLISQRVTRYSVSERMADFTLSQRPAYYLLNWTRGTDFADWHDVKVEPADTNRRYLNKPVIAITSANCFSACDTFTSALKANALATILGEATGGGTGSPLVFELPVSGFSFRYGVVRGVTAHGDPIEGVGTSPDVIVEATAADRIAKRDVQMEAAVKEINARLAPGTAPADARAAAAQAVAAHGPVWAQNLDEAPTLRDFRELARLSLKDGLD